MRSVTAPANRPSACSGPVSGVGSSICLTTMLAPPRQHQPRAERSRVLARSGDDLVARREIESRDCQAERLAGAARELHFVGLAAEKRREARGQTVGLLGPARGCAGQADALHLACAIFGRHGGAQRRTAARDVQVGELQVEHRLRAHPLPELAGGARYVRHGLAGGGWQRRRGGNARARGQQVATGQRRMSVGHW